MRIKHWLPALAAGLGLLFCGGCAVLLVGGAAAGAGTVVYVKGELQATEDVPLEQAWAAARSALTTMQMVVSAEQKDALNGQLTARAPGDKRVVVRVTKITGTTSEIGVRVGLWGEEALSREILEHIRKQL